MGVTNAGTAKGIKESPRLFFRGVRQQMDGVATPIVCADAPERRAKLDDPVADDLRGLRSSNVPDAERVEDHVRFDLVIG